MKNKLYICFVFSLFLLFSPPAFSNEKKDDLESRLKKLEVAMAEMQQNYQEQIAELQKELHQLRASDTG